MTKPIITCVFNLTGRKKYITKNRVRDCWLTFKKDFNEAISEITTIEVCNESTGFSESLTLLQFQNKHIK